MNRNKKIIDEAWGAVALANNTARRIIMEMFNEHQVDGHWTIGSDSECNFSLSDTGSGYTFWFYGIEVKNHGLVFIGDWDFDTSHKSKWYEEDLPDNGLLYIADYLVNKFR